jgi:1,4-dihydroxy-2-naphthoate octaprenyltransferase
MPNIRTFSRIARPLQLLLAALTYSLGAGISRYLGHPVQMAPFVLGLLAVLAIQAAAFWLVAYFRLPLTPLAKEETSRNREALQAGLFQSAMAMLTGSGAIIVTLIIARMLPAPAMLLMGLIIFFSVIYAVPPSNLSEAGYGELVQALLLGILFPALAFFIQYGEFHRLLAFATFPITLLALAYFLVNDFPTFSIDQKYGRQSMLIRLTWQRAIPIHHILILVAFFFFAITPLLGFPWRLVWPVFLAMPFALIEIIWLQRIAGGGRALWKFLIPLSAAFFGLVVYLLALTFWIR